MRLGRGRRRRMGPTNDHCLRRVAKMADVKPDEEKNEKYDRDDRHGVRLYSNAV